jgi:hypothetical protein
MGLWALADDGDVEHLRARFDLSVLTAEERASVAEVLVESGLPWDVIERRLIDPGVMAAFVEASPVGDIGLPFYSLSQAALDRGLMPSLVRLANSAGPARACFVENVLWFATGSTESFEALKPHMAALLGRDVMRPYRMRQIPKTCDPTTGLLEEAFCWVGNEAAAARARALWVAWIQTGAPRYEPAIARLTTSGSESGCRLAAVLGDVTTFRRVERP